jgi:hypothetical protein
MYIVPLVTIRLQCQPSCRVMLLVMGRCFSSSCRSVVRTHRDFCKIRRYFGTADSADRSAESLGFFNDASSLGASIGQDSFGVPLGRHAFWNTRAIHPSYHLFDTHLLVSWSTPIQVNEVHLAKILEVTRRLVDKLANLLLILRPDYRLDRHACCSRPTQLSHTVIALEVRVVFCVALSLDPSND